MKTVIITFISLVGTFSLYAQPSTEKALKGLDTEVAELLDAYHAAGLAIAVVKEGSTVYQKGFGYRDVERQLPVDEHTVFGIGSVTKSFTASLLGKLEGEDKLSLSDRPRQHIPELRFYNTAMDEGIQIRNILAHSTGIGRMSSESSSVLFQSEDRDDLIGRLAYLEPEAGVGEAWLYSNYMYAVAGILSERITGKSWATNIQEMIFTPLAMRNSYAGVLAASKDNNFSLGYAVAGNQPTPVLPEKIPTRAPGGDIYSSASDMAEWVKLWLNGGKYQDRQFLPAAYVDQAISPQQIMWGGLVAGNPDISQFTNYGFGWMNSNYKGFYKVEHSGGTSGYTSNVVFFPKKQIGIVILSNQTGSNLPYRITDILLERLLSIPFKEKETPQLRFTQTNNILPANTKTVLNEYKKPTHSLEEFTGTYSHPGYGALTIFHKEGTLYAEFPFTTFRLEHVHYNVFHEHFTEEIPLTMWPFMNLNFSSDAEGQINSLWINFAESPVEFRRPPRLSIAEKLQADLDTYGEEAAVKVFWELKAQQVQGYSFVENDLNALGYNYLASGELDKAITVFKLNVATHPHSFNAYDSLGEAYMKKDNQEKAIENYKKSVLLNPRNQNGIDMLSQLGVHIDPENLASGQDPERALITQTLMDYIEGTADGDADRIRRAFHADLNLYTVDQEKLKSRSGQNYISLFEDGKKRNRIGKIISIDYVKDAAMAKIEVEMPGSGRLYTDYLLLLKIDGAWKIIHKSYTYE